MMGEYFYRPRPGATIGVFPDVHSFNNWMHMKQNALQTPGTPAAPALSAEVSKLIKDFHAEHGSAVDLLQRGAMALIQAARTLTKIRERCHHGTWAQAQVELGLDRGRVERLLRIGDNAPALLAYTAEFGDVSQSAMLSMLKTVKDEGAALSRDPAEAALQLRSAAQTAKAKQAKHRKEHDHFAALRRALADFEEAALQDPEAEGTAQGLNLLRTKALSIPSSVKAALETIDMDEQY